MAYNRSTHSRQRASKASNYKKKNYKGLIWGTFTALFRLARLSFVLILSTGFVVCISIALLYGYNSAMSSDFFALKEIKISGNRQLTHAQMTELMDVHPGDSILQLRMFDLHAKLSGNPWIDEVSIKRVFPDRLVVKCRERQAYFWLQNRDKLYYADKNGRTITPVSPVRYVSLPILYIEDQQQDHDLESVVVFLENRSFPFSFQDISWIRVKKTGTVEMHIGSRKIDIALDRDVLDSGPGRLSRVWSDLGNRGEDDAVDRIIIAGRNAWVGYGSQGQH